MRVLRLLHGGDPYFAELYDDATARLWTQAPWAGGVATDRFVPIKPGALLPPVTPSKIVCVGRNYRAHAKELGNEVPAEPLLFLKPPSALLPDGQPILLPSASVRVEHEAEIGVVIGRRLTRATPDEAREAIFGLTPVNDVTARDLQKKDVQFTRAKSFDTFCPVGPFIETAPPTELLVEAYVNGALKQRGNATDMLWPVVELLVFISAVMTLEPGDLLSTGTPEGVGPLVAGDEVEIRIPGLASLRNPVRASP